MPNKIRVDLRIIGFNCSPDEITSSLGVFPTRTWEAGMLIYEKGSRRYKENGWELSSGLGENSSFEEQVDAIVEKIHSHLESFIAVCSAYYVELSCAMYIASDDEESTPPFHIKKRALKILSQIDAEIDVDIYVL